MKRLRITFAVISTISLIVFLALTLFNGDFRKDKESAEEIFATDITISVEFRSLTLYLGNTLKFNDNPYVVTPSNYNQGVEVKILNYIGQEKEGAIFKDNCFKATEAGTYYIRFIVKTKYNTTKYDTIKISVIDKIDENCKSVITKQEASTISTKESLDVADFISVNNLGGSSLRYKATGGIMNGSIFIPKGMGTYTIEIIIDNGDYLIVSFFTVVVELDDEIGISLYDVTDRKINYGDSITYILSDQVAMFSYIVDGLIKQIITVEITNKEIVSLMSCDAPIIVVELTNIGETEIIIKIPNNNYEFKFNLIVQ